MLRPRKRLAAAIALGFFLQYGGLLLDVHNSRIPIVTPGGRYYTDNPAVAQDIAEISQWWREFRPDQGTVFAYPFRPALYTLFALKPASHFFMMFPLNYSREDLQTTMEDLRRNQPEWILYSPFSEAIFKDLPKVDPVLFKAESRVYDEQILAGYQLYRDGSTRIYRRRPVEGTAP